MRFSKGLPITPSQPELPAALSLSSSPTVFSTVRLAQHIVVLSNGRVIEAGAHETLMAQRGLYYEMFTLQAGAYGR